MSKNAFAALRELFIYGLRPAPPYSRCKHLGALPQTPRSPRGRGAWRAGFALLHAPYHQALVATASIKGTATPEMLTRSVLGLRPALRVRLPLSPLTLPYAKGGF